jgi:hypothetical protein
MSAKAMGAYFDRFDICEAYYLALSEWHGGQGSDEYRRLCKLTSYFKPRPMLTAKTLSDNGKIIYRELVIKLRAKA